MSFNKRYVDDRKIIIYKDNLDNLFTDKIDVFFFMDNFSREIFDLYNQKKFDLIKVKIFEHETNPPG
jgi:hypothetical protein